MSTQTSPRVSATPPTPPALPPAPRRTAGRVAVVVLAVLLLLGGSVVGALGTAAVLADRALRSDDGWVEVARDDVSTSGYAVVLGDLVLDSGAGSELPPAVVGDLRVRTAPGAGGGELFTGIARTSDLESFLGRSIAMSHRPLPYLRPSDRRTDRRAPWMLDTRRPAGPPAAADIWEASGQGTGVVELTWTPRPGEWSLVVMRADAARGVTADVAVDVTLPWLDEVGVVAITVGVGLLVAGALCLAVTARRPAHPRGR